MSIASAHLPELPNPGREARRLVRRLERVRREVASAESRVPLAQFGEAAPSARNLLHYLALRRFDLRKVQDDLADLGLSSLGRSEGHVLHNLDTVLSRLYLLSGRRDVRAGGATSPSPTQGRAVLEANTARLFGRPRQGRSTRIMATMPTEAASDPKLVPTLQRSGMDCMRINCAHDSPAEWLRMVQHVRRAGTGRGAAGCCILMDLGGPRLRTGALEPGPAVLKLRPTRDPFGRVVTPARVAFVAARSPVPGEGRPPEVLVPVEWLRRRRVGERVRLRDARGARRSLRVESASAHAVVASLAKSTYLTNGLRLRAGPARARYGTCAIRGIPARSGRIRTAPGTLLRLTPGTAVGHDVRPNARSPGTLPQIGVTLPEVLARVEPGHRVWFDGGRIGGRVRSVSRDGVLVLVDVAPPKGTWLRADQGVNLPDTDLGLPPLTAKDREDLRFIVRHADLVGYSFVQSAYDVNVLQEELRQLGRPRMGIVLKIETRRAFEQLPAILLAALRAGPAGVMVARGDLAVEVGFERLAEVQEEILWLCEAAHLPAIWATQVLEGLAQSGIPSRAEVTDAAMGERAECVMLNKGPYLVPAVRALDSIVRRMQAHQAKKSSRLRHLRVAQRFLAEALPPSADPSPGGPLKKRRRPRAGATPGTRRAAPRRRGAGRGTP